MNHLTQMRGNGMRGTALAFFALFLFAACGGSGGSTRVQSADLDGDGILDSRDNDLDGDGRINQFDDDVDNDGRNNAVDADIDGDGTPNDLDETPFGPWIPAAQTLFVTSGVATISFGDVPEGQRAGPAEVTIQNDTVSNVRVAGVNLNGSGGGAFTIDTTGLPGASFDLAPGGQATFTASFAPTAGTPALGRVIVDLEVGGQSFGGVVHLLGMGSSPALLTSGAPSSINFGDVPVGITAGPGIATIKNDTSAVYTVSRIELTGTGGSTFALDLSTVPGGAVPFDIDPGAQVSFHVTFAPRQGVPSVGEVLLDLSGGAASHTLGLDLLGQGLAPSLQLTPAKGDFGTVLSGIEARDVQIEIANAAFANGDLNVTAIDFVDDAAGAFTLVSDPSPFTISPGEAPVVVTVRFAPDSAALGTSTGTLRISGNDPLVTIEHLVALEGRGAGWISPATTIATDLTVPSGSEASQPTALAGTNLVVLRSAGPNGVFGGALSSDDQVIVIDADPDGDAETNDARVLVRWSGFSLSDAPAGRIVDAGNRRHVFFLSGGLDGALGSADDQIYVLDTISGTNRSLAYPNAGDRKSRPVIVDPSSSRVAVATGVGGGPLASADTLLVYENLLGDLSAAGPSETLALEIVVPDLVVCTPVVAGTRTVVLLTADASDTPDLDDRALDDGNEGLVQVDDIGSSTVVSRIEILRALSETGEPADGDAFCVPVVVNPSSVLLATEGADATSTSDDELVRIDGIGTATLSIAAVRGIEDLSGAGSQPISLGGGFFVVAVPGTDGVYGSTDDSLLRIEAVSVMAVQAFGPVVALAGDGGIGSQPLPVGADVLVTTGGANGIVGDSDDVILQLDTSTAGASSVRGTLAVSGGVFTGDRTTTQSLSRGMVLDGRFLFIADRGADGLEGTSDDQLRVFRDLDQDGLFGGVADDLDQNGSFGAEDHLLIGLANAEAAGTPLIGLQDGHFLTIAPGTDGLLGGGDDQPVVRWLRGAATLR